MKTLFYDRYILLWPASARFSCEYFVLSPYFELMKCHSPTGVQQS